LLCTTGKSLDDILKDPRPVADQLAELQALQKRQETLQSDKKATFAAIRRRAPRKMADALEQKIFGTVSPAPAGEASPAPSGAAAAPCKTSQRYRFMSKNEKDVKVEQKIVNDSLGGMSVVVDVGMSLWMSGYVGPLGVCCVLLYVSCAVRRCRRDTLLPLMIVFT
jgi:hypothetical protein